MDYKSLVNNLKKGDIAPVYFFYGEEKYILDKATLQVIDATVKQEVKDFNLDVFYGNEVESGKILDIVISYPMMADKRTVVVKEVQKLSPSNLKALANYAESPAPTTCLVLVASIRNPKGEVYNLLKKKGVAIEFKPLYDNEIPAWIRGYVQKHGKEISMQAIQLLQAYIGNSLLNLVNELEKVFLNLGDRKQIEAEDVQSVVGFSKEFNIFNLTDAIGRRDLKNALLIVDHLLEQGELPTVIIIRITNYLNTLLKLIEAQKSRKSYSEISQLTGVSYYLIKNYKAQARNFTTNKIKQAFALLLEADVNLKTSYQTNKIIMDLLIYKLVRM